MVNDDVVDDTLVNDNDDTDTVINPSIRSLIF